ncbi:hypothetical protein ES702_04532 [subsurface metagenome]
MKMPVPDEKRDRQFKKDVEKGLSITQLAGKYQISKRQVSRLKKKLGLTTTSTQTAASTSTKRMTFWLPLDMTEKIKGIAAREKRTASAILREILGKYLQNK